MCEHIMSSPKLFRRMENVFIIVEGLTDVRYLSQLLGSYLGASYKVLFYKTDGYSSMLTSIRPIIDQVPLGSKVVFVFDADTRNQEKAEERLDFFKEQIGNIRKTCKASAFYFMPEIEDFIMGDDESYMGRKKVNQEEMIAYIESHRDELLKKSPVKDIIAFVEGKDQKQNPG